MQTLLVIDDEPSVLLATEKQLKDWGYTVLAARSLDQALKNLAVDGVTPDLILADYRLDIGITGGEAIDVIRGYLGVNVPGMLITGDTAPERLREAQASGFRLLHKPAEACLSGRVASHISPLKAQPGRGCWR